jgi:hypothetical protein
MMEKIDTHCHIVPPGWRKWCEELGWGTPDGMPCIPVCLDFSLHAYFDRSTDVPL